MDLEEIQHAIEKLPRDQQKTLAKWLRTKTARRVRWRRPHKARVPDQRVFFRSPALVWTVASLLLFLTAESLVFRLGWYNKYLEPDSSGGQVEGYLYWLKRFPHAKQPEVLVMGDSRIAEGFSARGAGAATGKQIRFWNFGIGGTTPRIWYYVLRDADPTRRRFAAIVLPIDEYADEDKWDSAQDRLIDLNYVIGRLRVTDCEDFASSMKSADFKAKALSGCLLKGIAIRRDAQEFLVNIKDRIKRTRDFRINGLFYVDDYKGRDEDLHGLSADFVHRTIHYPPGLSPLRHTTVEAMVMSPLAPQGGELTRYRKLWLGRILDLYKDSPTKIIFLELPRAPVPKPESPLPARFLQWAKSRPNVSALPSATFRDLERPDVFFDGLHLNKIGRGLFTEKLATQVQPLIATH
jgi:hypothetical protein